MATVDKSLLGPPSIRTCLLPHLLPVVLKTMAVGLPRAIVRQIYTLDNQVGDLTDNMSRVGNRVDNIEN